MTPVADARAGRGAVDARQPLVFAHRGGAALAPENTLAAFENGMRCGADGLECDVHLSADGVPVVIHDATLDRTTNATGPVNARTAAELASVDAGFHFGPGRGFPFRGRGEGVPTLADVLRRCPDARVIIEMKEAGPAIGRAVAEVVRQAGAAGRVCLASFQQSAVDVVRAEYPELVTGASVDETRWTLYRSWVRWPLARTRGYVAFHVPEKVKRLRVVSRAFVRQAHREGQRVDVWVVDRPEDVRRLFDWGVDGVISDRPDVAVPTRDAWLAERRGPRTPKPESRTPVPV